MDRFFRGFTAGIVGGVAMNLWSLIAVFVLNLEILRFVDWASILLFGDLPANHAEGAVALFIQLLWVGFLGSIFAFLIPQVTSRGYLIKGALFGVVSGFFIYAIPILFQVPILREHTLATVLSNITGGIIWGLTLAQTLHWLDRKTKAPQK
ncbi:hypothetical protein [Dethiobacter alkaliphilus]|uniref:Uncharacterized protein n=1 Tax=Dethiobacter alkaliphilus AHT 1 TaxID=555088 RepID=C0GH25_DETAL|nr:hypothetical protein [Dethiobacter alkaliphilus]EEG77327.1 conserved hypothetical protein [Dethiobacter alkaliphilus AHT 1]